MPVLVHECHTSWVIRVQRRWERLNLVTPDHLDNVDVYTNNRQYFAVILYDFANSD